MGVEKLNRAVRDWATLWTRGGAGRERYELEWILWREAAAAGWGCGGGKADSTMALRVGTRRE